MAPYPTFSKPRQPPCVGNFGQPQELIFSNNLNIFHPGQLVDSYDKLIFAFYA